VQALAYYYDPVGNVTRIRDNADTQNVIYFDNQRVEPSADYTYDPIYRLIAATGREHLGQTGGALNAPAQIGNDDSFDTGLPQPGDGSAMGTYTETYAYDPVGNILTLGHQVSSGNWTRRYSCTEPSQIVATETGNRLSATSLPGDPAGGPFSATYGYDAHGNMTRMPHLPTLAWDERDRLRSTTRQVVASGTPETTFYACNDDGERVRKATDRQAPSGQNPSRKAERVYLGAVELYRELAADGSTVTLQRETLHVVAGDQRIMLVETRTAGADAAPPQLVRYQHTNHLGSSVLELDDQSAIISYEEYFPFGSTSYQAVASQTDLPKRYRYTGKERDTENDLYYQGTRYCAPWLARWTSCDPIGIRGGINLYAYVSDNPVRFADPTGNEPEPAPINSPPPTSAPAKQGDVPPQKYHWGGRMQDNPPPDSRKSADPNQQVLDIFLPPIIIRPSGTPPADPAQQQPPTSPPAAPSSPTPGNFQNAPIYANVANSVTTPGKGVVNKESYGAIVRDPTTGVWVFQPHVAEFHGVGDSVAVGGDIQATMGNVDSRGASFGATVRLGSSEDVKGYKPRVGAILTGRLNLTVGGNSLSANLTGIYTQPFGANYQLDINGYYIPATDASGSFGGVAQFSRKNWTIGDNSVTVGLEGGGLKNQHLPDDKAHVFVGAGVSVDTTPKVRADHEPEKKSQWSFYVEGFTSPHPGVFFTLGYGAAGRGNVM
jgi:RHS repeat-associated protein